MSSTEAKEIDPNQIVMSFAGVVIQGVMDGTFVEVDYLSNLYEDHVGAQGDVTRSRNADERATVTFTLAQSSDSNDLLTKKAIADRTNGTGKGELKIQDLNGTSNFKSQVAWIEKWPKWTRSKETQPCVWVIKCARLVPFIGGNVTIAQ